MQLMDGPAPSTRVVLSSLISQAKNSDMHFDEIYVDSSSYDYSSPFFQPSLLGRAGLADT